MLFGFHGFEPRRLKALVCVETLKLKHKNKNIELKLDLKSQTFVSLERMKNKIEAAVMGGRYAHIHSTQRHNGMKQIETIVISKKEKFSSK
jgi:hypothetical protein